MRLLPNDIDPECRTLCEAMNTLHGIDTFASCCGHNEDPFRIYFDAESLEALPPVAYWFAICHSGVKGWRVIAHTDCGMSPISFFVEGPAGDYAGAEKIAAEIVSNPPAP